MFVIIHVRSDDNPFRSQTEGELQKALALVTTCDMCSDNQRRAASDSVTGALMDLPSNMKFARKMGVFGSHAARLYTNRVFDTYWGQLLTPQIVLFLERTMQDLIIPVTGAKSVQAFLADKSTKV
jgi:hypothetical protein